MKCKEEEIVMEFKTLSNGVQMPILGYELVNAKAAHKDCACFSIGFANTDIGNV